MPDPHRERQPDRISHDAGDFSGTPEKPRVLRGWRIGAALVVLFALLAGVFFVIVEKDLMSSDGVRSFLLNARGFGPVLLIAVMAVAIVVSPIPSAPITIGAGAVYGHLWGTVYALIGAEIGALVAFEIARRLGRGRVSRFAKSLPRYPALESQLALSLIVCSARLLPAISFDVVSYAAGLTPIRRVWFAMATALGMIPATFLLSHVGAGFSAEGAGFGDVLGSLAVLGALMLLGGWIAARRGNWKGRTNTDNDEV